MSCSTKNQRTKAEKEVKIEKKESASINGVSDISESFSSLLSALCEKHLTSIVLAFTDKISQSQVRSQKDLLDIWNTVAPEYVVNLEASAKKRTEITTIPGKICAFYYVRSKKACDCEVSMKSPSGKYCSRHLKEEGKPEKAPKETQPKVQCCYENTKGDFIGKRCESNVSPNSVTGKYCSKHAKSAEKEKTSKKKDEDAVEEVAFTPKFNKELKVYVDATTGFIINKEDKQVYARLRDGKLTALTKDDIAYLTEHKYEFNTTLFATKHPNQSVEKDEVTEDSDTEESSETEDGEEENEAEE